MATNDNTNKAQAAPEKKATGSRGALALGFAYIGFKFGTIGTIIDANKAFKGEKLPLGEKLKQIFSGRLLKRMWNEIKTEHPDGWGRTKAVGKDLKYSIILNAAGVAAGAVLGWVRGDRIEDPMDLLKHPIKSLKAVLGPKPKPAPSDAPVVAQNEAPQESRQEQADTPANGKLWTQAVTQGQPAQMAKTI